MGVKAANVFEVAWLVEAAQEAVWRLNPTSAKPNLVGWVADDMFEEFTQLVFVTVVLSKKLLLYKSQPLHWHVRECFSSQMNLWSNLSVWTVVCSCNFIIWEVYSNTRKKVVQYYSLKGRVPRETSQELRMLSSVTINCQITKIVINPGPQLSVSQMSQRSQVSRIAPLGCSLRLV